MKLSKYTSFIPIDEQHSLLYNAMSGKVVFIKGFICGDMSIDHVTSRLMDSHEKQFIEAGILIPDDTDEIGLIEEQIREADRNSDEYILHINPTLDCNFRCWYCYENHISKSIMEEKTLQNVKSFIKTIVSTSEIKRFQLGFFGGEPLLAFRETVKPLIDYSSDLCNKSDVKLSINFTSNGSLLDEEIVEFLSHHDCGFQITLDGNPAQHDKTRFFKGGAGSYDTIVKNIHSLIRKGIRVIVRINFTEKNIRQCGYILNDFSDVSPEDRENILFDFQRVWQERSNVADDTEKVASRIRKEFASAGFTVIPNYIPQNVRNSCYGDKFNHCLINYNGEVFGCTARDFTNDYSLGKLMSDGTIQYDMKTLERRHNSKFSTDLCRQCRIAPLCGGGCKQRAMENSDPDKCTFRYTEADKDRIILDILEYHIENYW